MAKDDAVFPKSCSLKSLTRCSVACLSGPSVAGPAPDPGPAPVQGSAPSPDPDHDCLSAPDPVPEHGVVGAPLSAVAALAERAAVGSAVCLVRSFALVACSALRGGRPPPS